MATVYPRYASAETGCIALELEFEWIAGDPQA